MLAAANAAQLQLNSGAASSVATAALLGELIAEDALRKANEQEQCVHAAVEPRARLQILLWQLDPTLAA